VSCLLQHPTVNVPELTVVKIASVFVFVCFFSDLWMPYAFLCSDM